jgi:hypothetical protein
MNIRTLAWTAIAGTSVMVAVSGFAALPFAPPASADQVDQFVGVAQCERPQTQLCKQIQTVSVETGEGKLYVAFTVNPNDCADIIAKVFIDGAQVGAERAAPGKTTVYRGREVSPGTHTVAVQAQGIEGGCNTGFLSAWGGTVHIKRTPPPAPQGPPPEPQEPPEPAELPKPAGDELGEFDPCRPTEAQKQQGKDYNDDLCIKNEEMQPIPE